MGRSWGTDNGAGVKPGDRLVRGSSICTWSIYSSAPAVSPWRAATKASLRNFCALEKLAFSLSAAEQAQATSMRTRTRPNRRCGRGSTLMLHLPAVLVPSMLASANDLAQTDPFDRIGRREGFAAIHEIKFISLPSCWDEAEQSQSVKNERTTDVRGGGRCRLSRCCARALGDHRPLVVPQIAAGSPATRRKRLRRAGELLREMLKCRGGNASPEKLLSKAMPPTLSDLGITRDQSSKWQKIAAVPEEHFDRAESKSVAWEAAVPSKRR
jgi:hypothetical protein